MSKWRKAAKVDSNQPEIVKALRLIPGVTVEVNHDDLLVGRLGQNYWIELKEPETVSPVTGKVRPSAIKDSQHKLLVEWQGQYAICWELEQILEIIGVTKSS